MMVALRVTLVFFLAFVAFAQSGFIFDAVKKADIKPVVSKTSSGDSTRSEITLIDPDHLTFTWSNGTVVNFQSITPPRSENIDCFGLGNGVSRFLSWWYTLDNPATNPQNIQFYLSSRNKLGKRVLVTTGNQFGLDWSNFQIERDTVFIVHGFLSNGNEAWIKEMEDALLLKDDVNVVIVNWAAKGNYFNYYKAAVNTKTVGEEIARLLRHIVTEVTAKSAPKKPKFGKLHLIGHSLGAHICGVAAHEFKKKESSWKINRITGLDPAQPCYTATSLELQLDASDAPFVDVIHTNGKLTTFVGFGLPRSIGHVDYYPNGGALQPGCELTGNYRDYLPLPRTTIEKAICSHGRAYLYFTESINALAKKDTTCTFWAHPWDRSYAKALQLMSAPGDPKKCSVMGIQSENYSKRGSFFVKTSRKSPFCVTDAEDIKQIDKQLRSDLGVGRG